MPTVSGTHSPEFTELNAEFRSLGADLKALRSVWPANPSGYALATDIQVIKPTLLNDLMLSSANVPLSGEDFLTPWQ